MYFFMLLTLAAALNIFLWFFFSRRQNRRIEQFEQDLLQKHYAEVDSMYRKMRGWRHDYHNHIQAMKVCLAQQQYGQMSEYLNQIDTSLHTVDQVVKTGNLMVDAILNSKISLISERNISLDVTAHVPEKTNLKGIDICVLIGNLLDNAMEACMSVNSPEKRFIRIYIDVLKNQLYICITNSMHGKAHRKGSLFPSTKTGSHGFGLERIDRIVSQYRGYVNRQTEQGVFATEILLPLSV